MNRSPGSIKRLFVGILSDRRRLISDSRVEAEPRPEPRPRPIGPPVVPPLADKKDKRERRHHTNIHAQGDDIKKGKEPNVSWDQPVPVTKAQGQLGLSSVQTQCSQRQAHYAIGCVRESRQVHHLNTLFHASSPTAF